ncbi:MAG: helix-turn-helix domain-containing protein [Deltaproteobacteria bacterium]|nr:helix-turn-helix domain-containing protein [Deltaproteobacteria bacterium]MDZ4346288.1 helix-turn-helix domain-containing protein [Candidatus Binatia bacterium]
MPTKKTTYTITEAAAKLGVSRQAVHEAIKKGLLKARQGKIVTIGWLIPEDALKAYKVSVSHQKRARKK